MIIIPIFCHNTNTSQGQIVSSLDSYDSAYLKDPELAAATERALDRSRSEVTHLDHNSEQRSKSIIFIALLSIKQFYEAGDLDDVNESIQALVELCNSEDRKSVV